MGTRGAGGVVWEGSGGWTSASRVGAGFGSAGTGDISCSFLVTILGYAPLAHTIGE